MSDLQIVPVDLEAALRLRMTLSIPPRSREAAISSGDTAADTFHFGAYIDEQLVGVCSVGPEPLPILDHPQAWRGRGLMVLPEFRNHGVGSVLVQHYLKHVETKTNPLAWCYAKRHLTALYSVLGLRPTGYTYVHPIGGETLLFGNEHTRRLIQDATGIIYTDGELPCMGFVEQ